MRRGADAGRVESMKKIRFGMMNHPARDLAGEIRDAAKFGFDFLDLTLEPPMTGPDRYDPARTRNLLAKHGLGVVGHTGWHLPGAAAYPEVRRGVTESLLWAARHFADLGAKTMTYHIHGSAAKYIGTRAAIAAQVETLTPVVETAGELGVTVVLEHISGYPEQFEILDGLFAGIDELGFHLDAGHANLSPEGGNKTGEFLRRYGKRLRHVHISDNRGRHDDHLPLGVGTVDWPAIARLLKARRYRGTITLEVFTQDPEYLTASLAKARRWFGTGRG